MGNRKLLQLEAVRGIASVVVVFHHFALAFAPKLKTIPLLFDGESAVLIFFMLSGFVLTKRFFEQGGGRIGTAAIKRLPRLWLPVCCSILFGYAILASGSTWHIQAGELVKSDYLSQFAWAGFPAHFRASLPDALVQSLLVFYLPNHNWYNSNLWTMQPEMLGSLFCFAYAWFATKFKNPKSGLMLLLAILLGRFISIYWIMPFAIGIFLAQFYSHRSVKIGTPTGLIMLAVAGICLSAGHYPVRNMGAAILIITALSSPGIASALSGRLGALLGEFSFPLYLTHALVLCSASSLTFLATKSIVATLIITIIGSFIASLPLAYLDKWWVKTLNRLAKPKAKDEIAEVITI